MQIQHLLRLNRGCSFNNPVNVRLEQKTMMRIYLLTRQLYSLLFLNFAVKKLRKTLYLAKIIGDLALQRHIIGFRGEVTSLPC
jgi:hypothetical protein